MSILYSNEHINCCFYLPTMQTYFRYLKMHKGEILHHENMRKSEVYFVLKGSIEISCDKLPCEIINEKEIFFISSFCEFEGIAVEDTDIITCPITKTGSLCKEYSIENLTNHITAKEYQFRSLPFKGPLELFLDLMKIYIEDNINCTFFQDDKKKELMLLFRAYYTKEELANFFMPILDKNTEFREIVLVNKNKIHTIEKFAEIFNMSTSTFKRKFKDTFGYNAGQWLHENKLSGVVRELGISDKTFQQIADEYGFSSQAYLTTFCKKYYGKSPTEIRSSHMS